MLDFATSIVAEGKVLVASRGGKKLPKGALVDADGTLSEDPAVLYGPHTRGRAARPHQGHGRDPRVRRAQGLGPCLHLRVARRRVDRHRRDLAADRRFANGMLAFYVDPKVIDTSNFFDGEISRYVDFIRATKPVAGVDTRADPRRSRAEDARRAHQKRRAAA